MGWFKIGSDLRQLTKLLNKKVCGWVYNVNQNFSRLVLRFSTWVCTIFMCHGMYVAQYLGKGTGIETIINIYRRPLFLYTQTKCPHSSVFCCSSLGLAKQVSSDLELSVKHRGVDDPLLVAEEVLDLTPMEFVLDAAAEEISRIRQCSFFPRVWSVY